MKKQLVILMAIVGLSFSSYVFSDDQTNTQTNAQTNTQTNPQTNTQANQPKRISHQADFCGAYTEYYKFVNNYKMSAIYFENTSVNIESTFNILAQLNPGESSVYQNSYDESDGAAKAGIITKGFPSPFFNILCGISFTCERSAIYPDKYEYVISLIGNFWSCNFGPGSGTQDDPYTIILNDTSQQPPQ